MSDLVIVGDESWTTEEWEVEQLRRERKRAQDREYRQRPEVKASRHDAFVRWRESHRAAYRAYQKAWKRRKRALMRTQKGMAL